MFSGSLLTLLLAGGLFASCSTEEMTEGNSTPLPEGKYPLTFTVGMEGMTTRTIGKDAWVEDDAIGVRMGDGVDAPTGRYIIDGNNTVQPATAEETLYWQTTAPAAITAWYPYEAQNDVNISDQSAGFTAFDFLLAETTADYKTQGIKLQFKHQMAKVKYTLQQGEGISEEEFNNAKVSIAGYTRVSFIKGKLTGSNDGRITPDADGEALLVPQDMTDRPFIKVTIGNGDSQRDFYYTPTSDAGKLVRGKIHTYAITVKRTGIEVSSQHGEWSDEEVNGEAQDAVFRVYLPNGHGQTLTYSNNVRTKPDYLEVKGNPFTISYEVTAANNLNGFPIVDGKGTVERTAPSDGRTYIFTYNLRTDVHLEYSQYVEVGDYYYEDNTWLPYIDNGKACIGIVFKVGAGPEDAASNYENKLIDGKIHGYVVALRDAHDEVGMWGIRSTDVSGLTNEGNFTDKYNGYTNTQTVRNLTEYGNVNLNRPSSSPDQYWAFKAASDYATDAPNNSSGWYLPSIGQLQDIYNLPKRTELLTAAGGVAFKTDENNGRYWSSTEYNSLDAWHYQFNGEGPRNYAKGFAYGDDSFSYVRAVLTF